IARRLWTAARAALAVVMLAGVMLAGIAGGDVAQAQTKDIPVPRLSPAQHATPLPQQPEEPATPTRGQAILLQGANSPFADAGADAPEAATVPLGDGANAGATTTIATAAPADTAPTAATEAPGAGVAPSAMRPGAFTMEARLWAGGPPLKEGVAWRIFDAVPGPDGKMLMLGDAAGGVIHVRLEPGSYVVHTAFGRADAIRELEVSDPTGALVVVLDAGGIRLLGVNAHERPLQAGEVRFDIFAPDEGGSDERYQVVSDAPPGKIITLNAGTYHVVSYYGKANAIVRADIRVDPGQLTEVTLYQRAARLTLKLVSQHGGEAIANTEWSIVTPAGETVIESVGAFPDVVLSEGEYVAIARNAGRIFESNFTVEPGNDRDLEVLVR
ncbi:MAG: hypothetical protein ACTSYE_09500, partial [Alphaproteobacteria bacterium]